MRQSKIQKAQEKVHYTIYGQLSYSKETHKKCLNYKCLRMEVNHLYKDKSNKLIKINRSKKYTGKEKPAIYKAS